MTINAKEAHKNATNFNEEWATKLIKDIDARIDQAVCKGDFTATTPILTTRMKEIVTEHYQSYEYEVVDYNNNMLGINW